MNLKESAKKLEEARKKRNQEFDKLLAQYDAQNRANRSAVEAAQHQEREAEYADATTTGDESAKGFAAGSSFGPVGGIIGSVAASIPAKGKEFTARDERYGKAGYQKKTGESGNAVFDTWFNPATTIPSLLEGIFGEGKNSNANLVAGGAQNLREGFNRENASAIPMQTYEGGSGAFEPTMQQADQIMSTPSDQALPSDWQSSQRALQRKMHRTGQNIDNLQIGKGKPPGW